MNYNIKKRVQRKGGKALINHPVPDECPRCQESMEGRSYHSYLGHLGLHGLADRHFGGDIKAAHKRLQENGLARQDPFRVNGAFPPYRPIVVLDVERDFPR